MLSPVPLNTSDYGVLPSSPGPVAGSPLKWPFQSPGLGRTPGAYVVQEGRLSLEVFDLGEAHLESPKVNPSIDLLSHEGAGLVKGAAAALQRASSTAQLDLFASSNQTLALKTDNKVAAHVLSELAEAKAILTSKMLNALPEKLDHQMKQTIAQAKASVGLDHFDSSTIENRLQATLQHPSTDFTNTQNTRATAHHPSSHHKSARPQQLQGPQHQAINARHRRKRARPSYLDDLTDDEEIGVGGGLDPKESIVPPRKRLETINHLSNELRDVENRNRRLYSILTQTESKLQSETADNNTLWAMVAHIGAAIHAAVEERKGEAASLANALAAVQAQQQQHDGEACKDVKEKGGAAVEPAKPVGHEEDEAERAAAVIDDGATVHAQHQALHIQVHSNHDQQQQQQMTALKRATSLRHVCQPSAFTPGMVQGGVSGQEQLISPNGEDLFAACGMFSSPMYYNMTTTFGTVSGGARGDVGARHGGSSGMRVENGRQLFNVSEKSKQVEGGNSHEESLSFGALL